jgi:Tfp pilus assembly protein FimT
VELLVVIGIMALMAAITTVAVVPMMKGGRLRSGSRIVQASLYRARMYAAVNRCSASVWFYPKTTAVNGRTVEAGAIETFKGLSNTDLDLRLQEPAFLPAGVQFYAENDDVVFDPDEQAVGNVVVFDTTGQVDADETNIGTAENPRVRLQGEEEGTYKVIEVVFTTGLTRIYDQ